MQGLEIANIIKLMKNTQLPKNEFVREQIKNKPKNRKRLWIKLGEAFLCGIVFALAVSFVLYFAGPFIQRKIEPDTELSTESPETEAVSETEDTQTGGKDTPDTQLPENTQTPDDTQTTVVEVPREITLADYQRIQNDLYAIGTEANRSIVAITSVVSDTDWFNNSFERVGQGTGAIVGETEKEYLILTERKLIKDAAEIKVTFFNNTVANAQLYQYDVSTGLAIIAVLKTEVEETTAERIAVFELQNSGKVYRGAITIALGDPLGSSFSIVTGNITSTTGEISLWDSNYALFTTDIAANKNSSGILVDVEGQMTGIILQSQSASSNTLTALNLSEIRPVLDLLFEKKEVPYLGLHISTVTKNIADTYNLPKGVYVKEVAMDSPAMKAGIQSGDVITRIGKYDVMTDLAFNKALMKLTPKEEYPIYVRRFGNEGYQEISCQIKPEVLR